MRDGNKESTKELLSTFRTLVPVSLAIILFLTNSRKSLNQGLTENLYSLSAVVLLTASIIAAVYNCFLIIPKLEDEVDQIIYERDVTATSLISLVTFLIACAIVIFSPA